MKLEHIYIFRKTNNPKIQIRKLDISEIKLNDAFILIVFNENGKYNVNNGLFYSDGIIINVYKIAVILTSDNLLNVLLYFNNL